VRHPYRKLVKPGVHFRQETIIAIDPVARRVTTERSTYDAGVLVVALGADYDLSATPGLVEGGNEFYTLEGAERLRKLLPEFKRGRAIVGVTSTPFKCPPAPSEAALMLHEYLSARGARDACEISLVMPFRFPIPPSPEMSKSLLAAFAERGIKWVPGHLVSSLDSARNSAILDDGSEMPYDLFLGIPAHRAPTVVAESGMTEDGWIPVSPVDLKTRFPGVYAVGDVTEADVPKAGMFAETAARVAAKSILAELRGDQRPSPWDGTGACYVDFGTGQVGRVDMNFLSGQSPRGIYSQPSTVLFEEKHILASQRIARWFGEKRA
jgi:sulfide:quinone oxidoreductase